MGLLFGLLLLLGGISSAFGQKHIIYGSGFATFGEYSGMERWTREWAAYSTAGLHNLHFLTAGYGDLHIEQTAYNGPVGPVYGWTYNQRMAVLGANVYIRPVRVKLAASRITGKFQSKDFNYSYRDWSNLFSGEVLTSYQGSTAGISYTHIQSGGFQEQRVQQFTGRLEQNLPGKIYLTLRPQYSWVLDGRRVSSWYGKASWQPFQRLVARTGGALGERAYSFDNDLLTIYNQDFTQTQLFFVQTDFRLWQNTWFVTEYIHTQFREFTIEYAVFGLRSHITL